MGKMETKKYGKWNPNGEKPYSRHTERGKSENKRKWNTDSDLFVETRKK